MNFFGSYGKQKEIEPVRADPERTSDDATALGIYLRENVIGQERAIRQLLKAYESYLAGINDPMKPLANFLFLGPTGSGKTRIIEVFCEFLWGSPEAMIKIDCAEFQREHEVAKLIGAPPGYIGYDEKTATGRITRRKLEEYWKEGAPRFSVVLFDEVEKADPALHQVLLGIFDKGTLTLGKNEKVNLRNSFIILTSNLGAKDVARHLNSQEVGFSTVKEEPEESGLDQSIYDTSISAAKKFFQPEFLNRLDRIVVFRSLSDDAIRAILEIELRRLQSRLGDRGRFIALEYTEKARKFLVSEGTSREFGARELRRAIERFVVNKIARILATRQASDGDKILIDCEEAVKELSFFVLRGVVLVPTKIPVFSEPKDISEDPEVKVARASGTVVDRRRIPFIDPCMFCGGYFEHRTDCRDIDKPRPKAPTKFEK